MMKYLADRLLSLEEAADLAGCGVRDFLELGARRSIPLFVYIDHKQVEWGQYDAQGNIKSMRMVLENGYFELEPEAIKIILGNGLAINPWVKREDEGQKTFGCVWPGPRHPRKVRATDLLASIDAVDKIKRQEIGTWTGPVEVEPGPTARDRQTKMTERRDKWIYERYLSLVPDGGAPSKKVCGQILSELQTEFPTRSNITPDTIRRILGDMRNKKSPTLTF